MVLYRLLSVIVNIIATFFAIALLFTFFIVFANPSLGLGLFLMFAVVAYAWFANKFYKNVIVKQAEFTKGNIDWLQVNAIAVFVFALLSVQNGLIMLYKPEMLKSMLETLPPEVKDPEQMMRGVAIALFVIGLILMVHVSWTFIMLRDYKRRRAGGGETGV